MARLGRVVAVNVPHHLTQRGNARRFILDCDADRAVYLNLLRENNSSGHAWQGRFYSCPLDEPHLWEPLRYTELNPVWAGLVTEAESWPWSSAATHCGKTAADNCLTLEVWQSRWTVSTCHEDLAPGQMESKLAAIRQCTHTGRPLGTGEFVRGLEKIAPRRLARRSGDVQKRSLSIEARVNSVSILSDCELWPVGWTPKDQGATCLVSCVFQSATSVCHRICHTGPTKDFTSDGDCFRRLYRLRKCLAGERGGSFGDSRRTNPIVLNSRIRWILRGHVYVTSTPISLKFSLLKSFRHQKSGYPDACSSACTRDCATRGHSQNSFASADCAPENPIGPFRGRTEFPLMPARPS